MAFINDGTTCECKFIYDPSRPLDNQSEVYEFLRWDSNSSSWVEVSNSSPYDENFDLWNGGNMNVSNLDSRRVVCRNPDTNTYIEQTLFCDQDQGEGVPGCEQCDSYPEMYDSKGHCYPHLQVPAWQYYEDGDGYSTVANPDLDFVWSPYDNENTDRINGRGGQYNSHPVVSGRSFCKGPKSMGSSQDPSGVCKICDIVNNGELDIMGAYDISPQMACSQLMSLNDYYVPVSDPTTTWYPDYVQPPHDGNPTFVGLSGVGERAQHIRQYCYNSLDKNYTNPDVFGGHTANSLYQTDPGMELDDPDAFLTEYDSTPFTWTFPSPADIFGCTDDTALNYDPFATADDGSCVYDTDALNYNPDATEDDGSCELPLLGCTHNGTDINHGLGEPEPFTEDEGPNFGHGGIVNVSYIVPDEFEGVAPCNYNPSANTEDGSCVWPSEYCLASGQNPSLCDVNQDGSLVDVDYFCPLLDNHNVVIDYSLYPGAPAATVPDGYLPYPQTGLDSNEVGCTDPQAFNFNGDLNFSDNSQCNY